MTQKDIDDFLIDINEALPDLHLTRQDVHYAYTGLYPLIVRKIEEDKYQAPVNISWWIIKQRTRQPDSSPPWGLNLPQPEIWRKRP